jgi:hypothetical protein
MEETLVASAQMEMEERGGKVRGMGAHGEEFGGGPAGTNGVGVGTVIGVGVGLRRQPHGIMGLITEPAFNQTGQGTVGSGLTYVDRRARGIFEIDMGSSCSSRKPMTSSKRVKLDQVSMSGHAAQRSPRRTSERHFCPPASAISKRPLTDAGRRSEPACRHIG